MDQKFQSSSNNQKLFKPLSRKQELELLQHDDEQFTTTARYLDPMIQDALALFRLSPKQRQMLHTQLNHDVADAAHRFLNNESSMKADYKFCTYFGWYIGRRINKIPGLKRIRF